MTKEMRKSLNQDENRKQHIQRCIATVFIFWQIFAMEAQCIPEVWNPRSPAHTVLWGLPEI